MSCIYVSNETFGTWNLNKGAVLEMINCVIKFSLKTIYTSPDFNLRYLSNVRNTASQNEHLYRYLISNLQMSNIISHYC